MFFVDGKRSQHTAHMAKAWPEMALRDIKDIYKSNSNHLMIKNLVELTKNSHNSTTKYMKILFCVTKET